MSGRKSGFRAAAVVLVSVVSLLSGCLSSDRIDARHVGFDAPPRFYFNPPADRATNGLSFHWPAHLAGMLSGRFGRAGLPDGHALDEAEANRQFSAVSKAQTSLTWFGHSTFLIRAGGRSILTDPVLKDTVGPSAFRLDRLAPVRPDPLLIRELDAILISHADFDHLDLDTLRILAVRFPQAQVFVPSGTAFLARGAGFANVREMAWYDRAVLGGVTVTAVPAIHGVRRPPYPFDSMHWSGYVVGSPAAKMYFSGDTAAGSIFPEIRRRLGPVDVALVPAGAWSPREFQEPFHASPEEAAEIARTLGARLAIGMHWGTFPLSEDEPRMQKERFLAASTPRTRTAVMRIGETRVLVP